MSKLTRRGFLKLSAFSLGAGLCSFEQAEADVTEVDYGVEKKVPLLCRMCAQFCPMTASVRDGRIVRLESNKNSRYAGICARGRAATGALYNPDRVKTPLIRVGERGDGKCRRASWDEAIALAAGKMKELRDAGEAHLLSYFPRFNSAAGLDKHFYSVYGTPNSVGYGDTCFGNSLTVSLGAVLGGSLASGVPSQGTGALSADYENAKYGLLIGRNPGGGLVTFPWGVMFGRGKANGMKVTCVDPRKPSEAGESDTDWLPIRPGTDAAFLLGVMNVVLSDKYYDEKYLKKYTNSDMLVDVETGLPIGTQGEKAFDYMVFDADGGEIKLKSEAKNPELLGVYEYKGKKYRTALQAMTDEAAKYTPEWAEKVTGVPAASIKSVADRLNQHKPKVFIDRGYRSERYASSLRAKISIAVLNVLLGTIGAEGGLIQQRGVKLGKGFHSPKVEAKSIGKHFAGKKDDYLFASDSHYRRTFIKTMLDGDPYTSKVAVIDGQNIVGGSAAGDTMVEGLRKLELIIAITPFMNETTVLADIIFPSTLFMERDEPMQSKWKAPFPVIGVNRRAVKPIFGIMDTYQLYLELGKKIFSSDEYTEHFSEFEKRGMRMVWEAEYAGIKGLTDEEMASVPSLDKLLESGLWSADSVVYKTKSKGTPSGYIEPYSIYLAESYNKLKQSGYKYADHASPLPVFNEPFWMEEKKELDGDEYIPVTASLR